MADEDDGTLLSDVADATTLAEEFVILEWERSYQPIPFQRILDHVIPQYPSIDALELVTNLAHVFDEDYRVTVTVGDKVTAMLELATSVYNAGQFEELLKGRVDDATYESVLWLIESRLEDRKEERRMRGFLFHGTLNQNPKICPRCKGWIPTNENPGEYPGAMSRYLVPDPDEGGELSRIIEICSACGEDEAWMQVHEQGRIVPPHEWPIERTYATDADRQRQREAFAALEEFRNSEEGQAALEEWDDDAEETEPGL